MPRKSKPTEAEFVRMYYEHQYERVGQLEQSRLSITNYVVAISALIFTFGYQKVTTFTPTNGIVLPLIIFVVNYFAMKYIDRTSEFMKKHKERAHMILDAYAPELQALNEKAQWKEGGPWGSIKRLQKLIHGAISVTALVPLVLFINQILFPRS